MTESKQQVLQQWVKEHREAQAKREAFRKRDTERLLQMSDKAVALACKALFSVGLGTDAYTPWVETADDEAIEAFEILLHLTYEDWEL